LASILHHDIVTGPGGSTTCFAMDLNTIREVVRPRLRSELPAWKAGDAWLAGGTWLFSEPQPAVGRLIDIVDFGWPSLQIDERGLQIAATCTIAELAEMSAPVGWTAAPLFNQCCRAFLSSFKVWNTATVGGNLCMALPAGPMISLTAALDGDCTIWTPAGGERHVRVVDLVVGPQRNALEPGELLRSIELPLSALRRRTAFRQISLSPLGRSSALLIGTASTEGRAFALTVTASTVRPIQLAFPAIPDARTLDESIETTIPIPDYYDDVWGKPLWRKHMTLQLAEEIRRELSGGIAG
jgi:CO/xanthine dehydrogenase FAD-binding subunit